MEQVECLIVSVDFYKRFWIVPPAIILRIFFCQLKIFPLLEELPQKLFHVL